MPATMRDVAKAAGVSVKTVSNVVNDYEHVRPETREKVKRALADLGYQMNFSARQLKQGRTGMIGLAIPDLRNTYFAELAMSVMNAAEERGLTVILERTGFFGQHETETLTGERRRLTDGLLFSALSMETDSSAIAGVDYPLVLLGDLTYEAPIDHVTMANADGAWAATWTLIERGCRNIAVIGAHPGENVGTAAIRLEGFEAALLEAGLELDPRRIGNADRWLPENGMAAMRRILNSGAPVDGVFAMNDALAVGALRALHQAGKRVPDDVAIIGFDNVGETEYVDPQLSSIDPGREEIARTAVEFLVERIAGYDGPPRTHVTDFVVVERQSTKRA